MTRSLTFSLPILCVFYCHLARALCGEPQPRSVCAEYSQSKAVVAARLVRQHSYPNKDAPEYFILDMQLLTTFRGQVPASFQMYEGNDSGRLPVDWVVGRKYLLFLFPYEQPVAHARGTYAVEGCGNSGPLSQKTAALRKINALKTSAGDGGTISGSVGDLSPSYPVARAAITVEGTGGTFHAMTDGKGAFRIDVPSGQYRVKAAKNKNTFKPFLLSYEKPEHIAIEDGGCAQVQFTRDGN